ncbi:endonuclease NucS domain-containing protein [Leifsonia sp. L25]|uniref:endonuclease NucS domain-containing protein n=1 Tax=Actinomycetes TaxID=1760 RepID=UPI003D695C20
MSDHTKSASRQGAIPLEHILRDDLAQRLDLIADDLTLIQVEYPLPNAEGARGSIDILARDVRGDLVVIELKRSDQTARQALHELEKYVALLAASRGIRVASR